MIIYEGTNNLVSGAFLKCFSIYEEDAESNLQTAVVIVKSPMVCIFLIQND